MAKISHIAESCVAISINRTYPLVTNETELYDYTRGIWRVDRRRAENTEIALAVYKGEVVEVYEIRSWHPAQTTTYESNRDFLGTDPKGRSEFIGTVARGFIRHKYLGKRIEGRSYGSPIRYYNC
jgi:hypothetical protein